MLRLEKLHIAGFKSFGDSAEVVFPDGITAVVGPNGCGKSNIGDAINWVLGEQSAKMLRGSSMQDVIFNGTDARKPVGLAEVSLHLVGTTGVEGDDPKRIVVTRRLYRDGESEYLMNGHKTRLRDIQDLLREERVGAQTYATIEQGRIEAILNAKPKDRRLIIEEAAGIAGFKHKRRLAELKLDATHANLLRVNDILLEVTRQINSLKRQAAKARRYSRLRDELRQKESVRFALRARALDEDLKRLREREGQAREDEAAASARLAAIEASLVEERLALEEAERRARAAGEALHLLDIEIDRKESRARACRERIVVSEEADHRLAGELEAMHARRAELDTERSHLEAAAGRADEELRTAQERLDALQREATDAERAVIERRAEVETLRRRLFEATGQLSDQRNRRRSIEEALDRARQHAMRLAAERTAAVGELASRGSEAELLGRQAEEHHRSVEDLQQALASSETALRDVRATLREDSETLATALQHEKSHGARLRTLEDVATRFAGVSDGVRMVLTRGAEAGVRTLGVVADFVEAVPEFEAAAEAYLQGLLPAVVVGDDGDAERAARLVRDCGAGRTLLLSSIQPAGSLAVGVPANGHAPLPDHLLGDPRIVGRLKDRITIKSGDGFVRERIGDAVLVDSLEAALDLHRRHPQADYLTPTGEVVYASGLVAAGGAAGAQEGLLAHNRKIQEERHALVEASALAATLQERVDACRAEEHRLDVEVATRRAELEVAQRLRSDLDLKVQRTEDDRARASRRVQVLSEEIENLEADARRMESDLGAAHEAVAVAETAFADLEGTLAAGVESLDRLLEALRAAGENAAAVRADVGARRQRQSDARREIERLSGAIGDVEARIAQAAAEREGTHRRRDEAQETLRTTEIELGLDVERRQTDARTLAALEAENDAARAALQEKDGAVREARADLDACRDAARDAELARARSESDRGHLDDLCVQELGVVASEAAGLAGEAMAELETLEPGALEAAIADLKEKIDQIGPVNLMAIDEFQGLEERFTFLTSQKKDLEESIESLKESIRRINRQSREKFLEVFEAVRASYQEIFRVLFNGGRADLILEESEDVLEAGIEMIAQPPGKKLGSVMLMSGGEKSMSALALLFAIFRIQPSPFCLLDEVDAALDELNVTRFTRMLKEYATHTQFILITHNKRSMEAANLLYGVTMEEPGVSRLVSMRV
jgi:chromosome segregation protein